MSDEGYKPVRLNSKKAVAQAKLRPGFTEAWSRLMDARRISHWGVKD